MHCISAIAPYFHYKFPRTLTRVTYVPYLSIQSLLGWKKVQQNSNMCNYITNDSNRELVISLNSNKSGINTLIVELIVFVLVHWVFSICLVHTSYREGKRVYLLTKHSPSWSYHYQINVAQISIKNVWHAL